MRFVGLRVVLQSTPRFRGPRAGVRQFTDTTKEKVEEYVKKPLMVAIGTAAVAFGASSGGPGCSYKYIMLSILRLGVIGARLGGPRWPLLYRLVSRASRQRETSWIRKRPPP